MCVWEGIFVILAGLHWLIVEPHSQTNQTSLEWRFIFSRERLNKIEIKVKLLFKHSLRT